MTESLGAKYIGLLVWLLGIFATRILPAMIANVATTLAVFGFVAWLVWESRRTHREVRRQLNALAMRRQARRDTDTLAPVR